MRINCLQVMILLCGVTMILLFGCIQQNTSSIEDRSKLGIDVGIKNLCRVPDYAELRVNVRVIRWL